MENHVHKQPLTSNFLIFLPVSISSHLVRDHIFLKSLSPNLGEAIWVHSCISCTHSCLFYVLSISTGFGSDVVKQNLLISIPSLRSNSFRQTGGESPVLTEVCWVFPPQTNAALREYEVEKKTHWCLKEQFSVREEEAAVWEEMLSRRWATLPRRKNIFTSETKRRTQHVKLRCVIRHCGRGLGGRLVQSSAGI